MNTSSDGALHLSRSSFLAARVKKEARKCILHPEEGSILYLTGADLILRTLIAKTMFSIIALK